MTAVSTQIKDGISSLIRPLNMRLESWTAHDRRTAQIAALEARGALSAPVYALTGGMERFDPEPLAAAAAAHADDLARLLDPARNSVGYTPENDYFRAADASALYLMVRSLKPKRIVEVGCGNSTRIARQAIGDGDLDTVITAVDPEPRVDIEGMVDRFERTRLEEAGEAVFQELAAGDFLFIDSSHEAVVGNDVAYLFCRIIPALQAGVIVHVHDIFLPYEYPPALAYAYPHWGEQYVAHALVFGRDCDVLWPGHHVERDRPELHARLPFVTAAQNQSFWFRWR